MEPIANRRVGARKWTRWSSCVETKVSPPKGIKMGGIKKWMRVRFQKCNYQKDVRKCPKEVVPCRFAAAQL